LEKNIKAVVKIYGLPHSSDLKQEEIFPAINEVCPPESVLVVITDSFAEICDGNKFHPLGNSPILIEIFSLDLKLTQAIKKKLLACKSAKRFMIIGICEH
jgi:hypothetical protein